MHHVILLRLKLRLGLDVHYHSDLSAVLNITSQNQNTVLHDRTANQRQAALSLTCVRQFNLLLPPNLRITLACWTLRSRISALSLCASRSHARTHTRPHTHINTQAHQRLRMARSYDYCRIRAAYVSYGRRLAYAGLNHRDECTAGLRVPPGAEPSQNPDLADQRA